MFVSLFQSNYVKMVSAPLKHAAIVTPEEEDMLLEKGVMGVFAPKPLVQAVFFYVGKAFCLRGGAEQRSLKPSQFVRGYEPDRYTFTQNGSKNHQGGFGTLSDSNKVVTVYSTLIGDSGDFVRDVVYLLDMYFSKFPMQTSTFNGVHVSATKGTSTSRPKRAMVLSQSNWKKHSAYVLEYHVHGSWHPRKKNKP